MGANTGFPVFGQRELVALYEVHVHVCTVSDKQVISLTYKYEVREIGT